MDEPFVNNDTREGDASHHLHQGFHLLLAGFSSIQAFSYEFSGMLILFPKLTQDAFSADADNITLFERFDSYQADADAYNRFER